MCSANPTSFLAYKWIVNGVWSTNKACSVPMSDNTASLCTETWTSLAAVSVGTFGGYYSDPFWALNIRRATHPSKKFLHSNKEYWEPFLKFSALHDLDTWNDTIPVDVKSTFCTAYSGRHVKNTMKLKNKMATTRFEKRKECETKQCWGQRRISDGKYCGYCLAENKDDSENADESIGSTIM